MGNPLLLLWHRLLDPAPEQPEPDDGRLRDPQATGAIFLVLRRMRAPLIVLVLIFSVSVVGLALIPGQQPDGGTRPMTIFDSLYFMTYTATTIGFGEIPYALTTEQRMWVTFAIFFSVVGWAYAIGTLLALLQDRTFRRELATQRFARQVRRMPRPFLILTGFGEAGSRVASELDRRGTRMVVVDRSQDRIDALDLAALHSDVPALAANLRSLATLQLAGLGHSRCAGILALTDDDEANLAVVQAAHLLRPELPVIARADTRMTAHRMEPFGGPTVVEPFDAFGDRLRLTVHTPALAQLFGWLVSPTGAPLPPRLEPPREGRWILVGQGAGADEIRADLTLAGLEVDLIVPPASTGVRAGDRAGAGTDRSAVPAESAAFGALAIRAVGLVAASERDTVNVSYVDAARRANPGLFVVARQELPANTPLFDALAPDLLLVQAEVVAREVLERIANPAVWEFLTLARRRDDQWARTLLDQLVGTCGPGSPTVWQVRVDETETPALVRALAHGPVRLGELTPSPFARAERLPITTLMLDRAGTPLLVPGPDVPLAVGDVLLVAGGRGAQRGWNATLTEDDMLSYVRHGQAVATSWWGRRLLRSGG